MSKDNKKIPVGEFISEKKLEKIKEIIDKSEDIDFAYDRIENLLDDDFKVLGLGTNRIVFVHKKDKYKKYIFKVAGDKHGIEANFRELYNGDLDKRLTYTYSVSKNGVFSVQEKVKVMDSGTADGRKKDIREMLHHLSKKILLVDCKLRNFRNFGTRKDGEVCLLDHGDTVPLPTYQATDIVNMDEESFVSLKCKEFADDEKKLKPCGGKLTYDKNYEFLECSKCGKRISVNDAYKEFYGDAVLSGKSTDHVKLGFDVAEWSEKVRDYCIGKMDDVGSEENNDNEGDSGSMTNKIINNENCVQCKGYWIPQKYTVGMYAMKYLAVRTAKMKPADYLQTFNLNTADYKVTTQDHQESSANKQANNTVKPDQIHLIANKVVALGQMRTPNSDGVVVVLDKDVGMDNGMNMTTRIAVWNAIKECREFFVHYTRDGFELSSFGKKFRKAEDKVVEEAQSEIVTEEPAESEEPSDDEIDSDKKYIPDDEEEHDVHSNEDEDEDSEEDEDEVTESRKSAASYIRKTYEECFNKADDLKKNTPMDVQNKFITIFKNAAMESDATEDGSYCVDFDATLEMLDSVGVDTSSVYTVDDNGENHLTNNGAQIIVNAFFSGAESDISMNFTRRVFYFVPNKESKTETDIEIDTNEVTEHDMSAGMLIIKNQDGTQYNVTEEDLCEEDQKKTVIDTNNNSIIIKLGNSYYKMYLENDKPHVVKVNTSATDLDNQ